MQGHQKNRPRLAAEKILKDLGIQSAPVPVERIAKYLDAQVRYSPLDQELSGMIYIKDGVPIIGVNSLHHPNRQRFTIAHELGHLILHKDLVANSVHVDKEFRMLLRGPSAGEGTDRIEIEANEFGAELLIPRMLLDQMLAGKQFDIDDDQPFQELAKRFRVSRQMLSYRIRNLGRE